MNRELFSYIAHKNLKICNPINEHKIDQSIERMRLIKEDLVLDIGAAKCELAIRLIEKYGLAVDAVDIAELFLSDARHLSLGRIDQDLLRTHKVDANDFISSTKHKYSAGICVGSTHALGGYVETLTALKRVVIPGGYILVGEGYWKNPPPKEFLEFLGSTENELGTHDSNILTAQDQGLTPLWATVASEDDWDHYEWSYSLGVETYAFENPNDPDVGDYLKKIRDWRQATLKWGRDTFGFGLYLFRN